MQNDDKKSDDAEQKAQGAEEVVTGRDCLYFPDEKRLLLSDSEIVRIGDRFESHDRPLD